MFSNAEKKKIARKIAALERIIEFNKDPKAVESAKIQIKETISSNNLDLGDLLELDELILKYMGQ